MELRPDTRIIDLTLGELESWFQSKGFVPKEEVEKEKRYVYGYKGVEDLLNISHTKVYRLIKGKLKDAVLQSVKSGAIILDVNKAEEILRTKL